MRKAIIVDVDGTIADLTHRLHYIKRPNKDKDYPAFFAAMHLDKPKYEVMHIINALSSTHDVLFVTGRPNSYRQTTLNWAKQFPWEIHIKPEFLFMRPDGNFFHDHVLKADIYEKKIKGKYDVIAVFDDRQSVVDMWRSKGLTCFQVDQWEEFHE